MYLLILAMDGNSRAYGERIMNIKRIAALLTLGALLSTAAPALAVAPTGTVNVEWNYAITATITMYTQTTASQTYGHACCQRHLLATARPAARHVQQLGHAAGKDGGGVNGSWATRRQLRFRAADSAAIPTASKSTPIDAYIVTNDSLGANLTVQASGAPTCRQTTTGRQRRRSSASCPMACGTPPVTRRGLPQPARRQSR